MIEKWVCLSRYHDNEIIEAFISETGDRDKNSVMLDNPGPDNVIYDEYRDVFSSKGEAEKFRTATLNESIKQGGPMSFVTFNKCPWL